ncbi:MAG: prepilin-type N-terminal cleavage/methylation domain-containing protein [Planctomycetaceae bacterium]|nr:prepilin-type N-terminal cleavage/methylation domain-containing protein [Planctomycetaceae bacterium]
MKNRAFTLLELLLVLGIIVAIAGLGVPLMQHSYVRSTLRAAAKHVQAEMDRTHLAAMKSGKAFVFRYRYGTSEYEVLPKEVFEAREKNKTGLGAVAVGSFLTEEGTEDSGNTGIEESVPLLDETDVLSVSPYQKILPGGMIFSESTSVVVGGWSAPILFYPNGRTSQAVVSLRSTGRYEFRQNIILRGLTGTARLVE